MARLSGTTRGSGPAGPGPAGLVRDLCRALGAAGVGGGYGIVASVPVVWLQGLWAEEPTASGRLGLVAVCATAGALWAARPVRRGTPTTRPAG